MSHLLTIGLERAEVKELRSRVELPLIAHEMLPKVQIRNGNLFALHPDREQFVPVSKVIFHGIFEDDLPMLAALALWGGPCLPGAHGMLDCRPRIANLARVRRVSRFAAMPRGYADANTTFPVSTGMVAKWGEWHCGDDKERVTTDHRVNEPTLFEPFIMTSWPSYPFFDSRSKRYCWVRRDSVKTTALRGAPRADAFSNAILSAGINACPLALTEMQSARSAYWRSSFNSS